MYGSSAGLGWCASAANPQEVAAEAGRVDRMVAAALAGDQARLARTIAEVKSQPRPARGDRRLARALNEAGLAFWQRKRFGDAAALFAKAHDADASDAEIAENLGYARVKAGHVAAAEPAILAALALAPERASAWGTLGLIYAKQGKRREAVSSVLTAYRFAPNPERAFDVYTRLSLSDEDPAVRAMLAEVVTRLSPRP